MFKGELLVHFTGLNPDHVDETIQVQMLVDQSDVKGLRGQPRKHAPVDGFVLVTLLGEDGGDVITVSELAALSDVSPYEILTGLRLRLPRRYRDSSSSEAAA